MEFGFTLKPDMTPAHIVELTKQAERNGFTHAEALAANAPTTAPAKIERARWCWCDMVTSCSICL